MNATQTIFAFAAEIRGQIHIAEDAGAEHDDLCITLAPSYLTMAAGWPVIDIEGDPEKGTPDRRVALVPKLWARRAAEEAIAETGAPPPPSPASSQMGLWGFTPGFAR